MHQGFGGYKFLSDDSTIPGKLGVSQTILAQDLDLAQTHLRMIHSHHRGWLLTCRAVQV